MLYVVDIVVVVVLDYSAPPYNGNGYPWPGYPGYLGPHGAQGAPMGPPWAPWGPAVVTALEFSRKNRILGDFW